ncbi:MAG: CDP-glycerol glycerophosphotransferase family protein [Sphingomicrobium sp.]|nr:CDP-glycerol glycerophosphotransferase family protein [Sphingomonadales bacterium]
MRIAFLYIAEAYQCYHGAAVAIELARRPGIEVQNFYNDPETPHHLNRIRDAWSGPAIPSYPLDRSLPVRALQAVKFLGMMKSLVMRENARAIARFDVIVAVENTVAQLRALGAERPTLVYIPHGYGDRARGFIPRIAAFDLTLLAGQKTADRMLRLNLIRPDGYALPGYIKLETADRLAGSTILPFDAPQPIVLYNPHKAPRLESWSRFIEPMLAQFQAQDEFNLIVAPHVKLFRRKSAATRRRWHARSTGNMLIDLGSDASVDMSYSSAADIYVGDISSQVYEFLARPRPCVFLNAHGIKWQQDPSFAHWHFGEVVDDPAELMQAVRRAPALHHRYRAAQEAMAQATIGDRSPGAAHRAANAILDFVAAHERHAA